VKFGLACALYVCVLRYLHVHGCAGFFVFCDMQVSTVVLAWASEHYYDFEGVAEMEDFLDWFEQRLVEDVRPSC